MKSTSLLTGALVVRPRTEAPSARRLGHGCTLPGCRRPRAGPRPRSRLARDGTGPRTPVCRNQGPRPSPAPRDHKLASDPSRGLHPETLPFGGPRSPPGHREGPPRHRVAPEGGRTGGLHSRCRNLRCATHSTVHTKKRRVPSGGQNHPGRPGPLQAWAGAPRPGPGTYEASRETELGIG